jgi:hypothetical protein
MSRLDDVDLTLSLDKKEAKARLEAAQARLERLRLTAGGQLTGGTLGRRCACSSRAGTRRARAGRSGG